MKWNLSAQLQKKKKLENTIKLDILVYRQLPLVANAKDDGLRSFSPSKSQP